MGHKVEYALSPQCLERTREHTLGMSSNWLPLFLLPPEGGRVQPFSGPHPLLCVDSEGEGRTSDEPNFRFEILVAVAARDRTRTPKLTGHTNGLGYY